jgi:hypothetical protein
MNAPSQTLRWSLTLLIIFAMAAVSLLPEPFKHWFATVGILHAVVHVIAFAVLGVLGAGALPSNISRLLFGVCLLAVGTLIEIGQSLLYHNYLEFKDVLADAAGIALALMLTMRRVTAGLANPRGGRFGKG